MAAWKLAPALAAGDCIVLKPSSTTSLSVLELVRLIEGVLPAGVLNVITGKGSKSGQYVWNTPVLPNLPSPVLPKLAAAWHRLPPIN